MAAEQAEQQRAKWLQNGKRYALNSLAVLAYDAPLAIARKAGLASAKAQRKNARQKASGKKG